MRRAFKKMAGVTLLAFFISMLSTLCFASELIAPTRTLQGGDRERGRLTVFSEPPRLRVFIDEKSVGSTPLWLTEVKAGWHMVRIEEKETRIYLGADKAVEIGLFKGSFITLPEKKKEQEKPQRIKRPPATPPETQQPTEEARQKEELTRWELFVNGTLRHF